jgi:hypothetical protein
MEAVATLNVHVRLWCASQRLDDAEFARELERMTGVLTAWPNFRVLVSIGDEPVAIGGCTLTSCVMDVRSSADDGLPATRQGTRRSGSRVSSGSAKA